MSSILYLYENDMATISLWKQYINKKKDEKVTAKIVSVREVSAKEINEANIIFFLRPTDVLSYLIALKAQRAGRFLVIYCDDDLYFFPCHSFLDKSRVYFFRKTLAISHVFQTCSPRIAEKYKMYPLHQRSFFSDTIVNPEELVEHVAENEKIKIVYAAGVDHADLFEEYILPGINDLFEELGNCFSLTFVGVHPDLANINQEILVEYVPFMSFEKYREYMLKQNFDIGLAPLHNDEFSKCKYFNKFFEYSSFGILGIYADMEPYTYIIKDRENGLLASDKESWFVSIREAICDSNLRKQCVNSAQRTIMEEFNEEAVEKKIRAALPELFESIENHKKVIRELHLLFMKGIYKLIGNVLYLITCFKIFRENGLHTLYKAIKLHYRNKKTYTTRITEK